MMHGQKNIKSEYSSVSGASLLPTILENSNIIDTVLKIITYCT